MSSPAGEERWLKVSSAGFAWRILRTTPAGRAAAQAKMHMARTTGKASKLAGNFRLASPTRSARNFHAVNNSHFCERLLSCGNIFLNVVYWVCSRMSCRTTFAAEGHAKSISHRVNIPNHSAWLRTPFLGIYPKGRFRLFRFKLSVMKTPRLAVKLLMSRGDTISARASAAPRGLNSVRDAAGANQQQQFASAWARELFGQICVQHCVRYNQS